MANLVSFVSKLLFQFRWAFMSQERRYVYLWNRTREGMQQSFDVGTQDTDQNWLNPVDTEGNESHPSEEVGIEYTPFGQRRADLPIKGCYSYLMPTLPVPRHSGQVLRPILSTRVVGAFGLAPKGSSLGTLPLPLQTGHLDIIGIALSQFFSCFNYILFMNS